MVPKRCLHCGLQLPGSTVFCPECSKPIEDTVRVEVPRAVDTEHSKHAQNHNASPRTTTSGHACLHCHLQLPESAAFCPECGRPVERCYKIRPMQNYESDDLLTETTETSDYVTTAAGS